MYGTRIENVQKENHTRYDTKEKLKEVTRDEKGHT
jgi:hypothetical protein